MTNNNISPDELYLKDRESLILFEDARLLGLLQGVANFYTTRNDQSTWGNILRAIAQELSRLDYAYAYDVVNKDPQFLTPPDIRRRWAAPLYVSSAWPSPTQFDTAFKLMLIELISAYREGSTVDGIQKVIYAYTGINIQVQELYKYIGNGVYDQSDRNSIKVSVNTGNSSITLIELQQIISSLYSAIDLAKPAHVGLDFTAIFGEGDNIDCFLNASTITAQQYGALSASQQTLYSLTGYVLTNPTIRWVASTPSSTPYDLHTVLKDRNGNLQVATTPGKPGTVEPIWSLSSGAITTDGAILWENISPAVTNLALTTNVLTVTASNTFTSGEQVSLVGLAGGYSFLNNVPLSVLTSTGTTFTAAYTHANMASAAQSSGTVSYNLPPQINILMFGDISPTLQELYQAQYSNSNCTSSGISDLLRIFIKQIEEPPFTPMLIIAPVLDPTNPQTQVASRGSSLAPTLTPTQYAALPEITFSIVNTVADGKNAGYTFTTLSNGGTVVPPDIDLHEGTRVTITGCRSQFNVTAQITNVIMLTPTSGMFEIPLNSVIVSAAETGSGYVSPTLKSAYALQPSGQYALVPDSSLPPINNAALNPPYRWIQVIAIDRLTNSPLNIPTGEIVNWDMSHTYGLVAPRETLCWEIQSDSSYIFEET